MSKKISCLLILTVMLYAACCGALTAVAAEYSWARIVKDGVCMYADEECTKSMFILEKSYYAEILATLDNVYQVSVMGNESGFPAVVGYVRKIEVSVTDVPPLSPVYPTVQIYVTTDSAQLKLLPTLSGEIVIAATTTQKLNYYGKLSYYGKDWYYVYFAGKFGYIDVDSASKPAIAPHPTPLETAKPVIKPQEPDGADKGTETVTPSNTPAAEIILIVFVVLLASGLTLAMFLPDKGKKTEVFDSDI